MSDQKEAVMEIPKNLKGIYQQLQEIDEVLLSPKQSLDILVNGDKPVAAGNPETDSKSGTMPSMENLVTVIESIRRKSSEISRHTNRLVGN